MRLSHGVGVAPSIRIRSESVPELHHELNRYLALIFGSLQTLGPGSVVLTRIQRTHMFGSSHVLRESLSESLCLSVQSPLRINNRLE